LTCKKKKKGRGTLSKKMYWIFEMKSPRAGGGIGKTPRMFWGREKFRKHDATDEAGRGGKTNSLGGSK